MMDHPMEMDSEDTKKKYGKFDEWEIECAARTLEEALEIQADPEKLKYVKEYLSKKQKTVAATISSIAELKAVAKSKMKPDDYE